MDYKVELPDGSKIVMLYTKNFTWKDKEQGDQLNGAPFTGRVYRALKTHKENYYYVHLGVPAKNGMPPIEGVRITSLSYETPEWICDFAELDDYNIIDFDITAEDYENIGKWLSVKQQDLIDRLFSPDGMDMTMASDDIVESHSEGDFNIEPNELGPKNIMDLIKEALIPYDNSSMEAIQWISMRDPFAMKALTYLLKEYVEYMKLEDKSPIHPLHRDIATSSIGKSANIGMIAHSLEQHIANKTDDQQLMFKIFLSVIFELQRQYTQNHTNGND
jgi:hypothetical protein